MRLPREIATEPQTETLKVMAVLIPIGVRFELPDEVKERMTVGRVRAIDGVRVCRFYAVPSVGDIVEFKQSTWKVTGLHHEVHLSKSTLKDKMAIVLTEFIAVW